MSLVAHITDPHLKTEGNKRDEVTGLNARFVDRAKSLTWAVQDAKSRGCEIILFGGDLFENSKPAPYQTMAAITALRQHPWVIGIDGNHDQPKAFGEDSALSPVFAALSNSSGLSHLPEILNLGWGSNSLQIVTLPSPRRSALAQAIPNYADLSRDEADALMTDALEQIIRGLYAQLDLSKPSIFLGHVSLDVAIIRGTEMEGRDICVRLENLPRFTFAALGHIHANQDFARYGRPEVFYTGSTDRADFGEEDDAKYYTIMDTSNGTWSSVEIPCREYFTIKLNMFEDSTIFRKEPTYLAGKIVRVKCKRPEHLKPDYDQIRRMIEESAWDYYGISEEVIREETLRAKEIQQTTKTEDHLRVWHEASGCPIALPKLLAGLEELEGAR